MSFQTKHIPEGHHTVTSCLVVPDIAKAIEFYKKAFGAEEVYRSEAPDGTLFHGEIRIGDTRLMLGPSHAEGSSCEAGSKGCNCSLYFYTEDADAAFAKAVAAGAEQRSPVADQFWGDRAGVVVDPFGHAWFIATRVENLTSEQIKQRAEAYFAGAANK